MAVASPDFGYIFRLILSLADMAVGLLFLDLQLYQPKHFIILMANL